MKNLALAVMAAVAFAACSSSDARRPSGARSPAAPTASPVAAYRGPRGYAFATRDAPLATVLAESSATGRPALLFFWTDW